MSLASRQYRFILTALIAVLWVGMSSRTVTASVVFSDVSELSWLEAVPDESGCLPAPDEPYTFRTDSHENADMSPSSAYSSSSSVPQVALLSTEMPVDELVTWLRPATGILHPQAGLSGLERPPRSVL